ncbi:exported hypothetical protein [Xenorhabdus indica]|nr:exported hypothetical protein [Xenorhabdus indica]
MRIFFNFTTLIDRHPLVKNKLPIIYSKWEPLYPQTIAVIIPFIDNKKSPMVIITS